MSVKRHPRLPVSAAARARSAAPHSPVPGSPCRPAAGSARGSERQFRGEVRVLNAAARGREVLGSSRQVGDRRLEAVLDRAQRAAQGADRGQRCVDAQDRRRWRRQPVSTEMAVRKSVSAATVASATPASSVAAVVRRRDRRGLPTKQSRRGCRCRSTPRRPRPVALIASTRSCSRRRSRRSAVPRRRRRRAIVKSSSDDRQRGIRAHEVVGVPDRRRDPSRRPCRSSMRHLADRILSSCWCSGRPRSSHRRWRRPGRSRVPNEPSSSLWPLNEVCVATRSISARRCCTSWFSASRSRRAVRGVGGLHRQLADTLQVVGDFAERAFSRLRQRDAVVGVARGLVEAADLRREALGDREAGSVVLGAVDAQARRQALQGGGELAHRMSTGCAGHSATSRWC